MNLDELWNSPRNAPTPEARDELVRRALGRLRREQRWRLALLAWTFAILTLFTARVIGWGAARPAGWAGGVTLALMLAAQWATFGYWAWQFLRAWEKPHPSGPTIRQALETSLRQVESQRRSQLATIGLFLVFAPLLGFAIAHLQGAGKMAARDAVVASLLAAIVWAVPMAALVGRLRWRILPRKRALEALLQQYREEAAGRPIEE
jgi:hypothetical protein